MPLLLIASDTLAETAHVTLPRPSLPPPLSRRLVAGLAALATALSLLAATAVPARADNSDLVKAIAGLAAVALIAREIDKSDRRSARPRAQPVRDPVKAPLVRPGVPAVCAIDIDGTSTPTVRVFAERCLREEGFTWRLPESCARTVRIFGRPDRIFPATCLTDAGFDTGARPR
jgi:hypothetical protein